VSWIASTSTPSESCGTLLRDSKATLLVVSNRPATLARADQVITLGHGHVAQQRECTSDVTEAVPT
jgi:ABC-type multidrug transport system fused ATPase/permease subunit